MPASWVAASVRARLLAQRRIGRGGARDLSKASSLPAALEVLAGSPYGADLTADMSLEAAQRQIAATLLWNMRLIGGWLPPGGVQIMQPLAAWFELANIEERLHYLGGGGHPPPYQLGGLAIAWPAVSRATTPDAVRAAVAHSRWGDPGSAEPGQLMRGMRFRWAAWVAAAVPGAAGWAATASALLAARVRLAAPRDSPSPQSQHPSGVRASRVPLRSVTELKSTAPRQVASLLAGVDDASDLWRAEALWWSRLRQDAARLVVQSRFAPSVVVGAVALLAYDAWLTRAALAAVARGEPARGVFDAVA